MILIPVPASKHKLHFPIHPVRQGDLKIAPPEGKSFIDRLKSVWVIYSTVITVLFTVWLVVPAIADSQIPALDMPWTTMSPLVKGCTEYGGFEFKNTLYSCTPAGYLGGTLRMPATMSIVDRQIRLRQILPQNVFGYWVAP